MSGEEEPRCATHWPLNNVDSLEAHAGGADGLFYLAPLAPRRLNLMRFVRRETPAEFQK